MTFHQGDIIHSKYYNSTLVEVVDDGIHRSLYFSGSILQSRLSTSHKHILSLHYPRYMVSALLCQPNPKNILIIGLGAGSLIHYLSYHYPHCKIDTVEYSRDIINIAKKYFHIKENKNISLYCRDGLDFLKTSRGKNYDIIFIDAFDEKGMAKTIYSQQFFSLCSSFLVANGIISANLWSGNKERFLKVKKAIYKNSKARIYIPVKDRENIVVLAFNKSVPWSKLYRPIQELSMLSNILGVDFSEIMAVSKKHNRRPLLSYMIQ